MTTSIFRVHVDGHAIEAVADAGSGYIYIRTVSRDDTAYFGFNGFSLPLEKAVEFANAIRDAATVGRKSK